VPSIGCNHVADAQIRRDLAIVFRKDKSHSRAARAFMEIAVKQKNFPPLLPENDRNEAACLFPAFLVFAPAVGQRSKPSAGNRTARQQADRLKATGTARYTDQEILAASGLHIGQPAADGDFKEAIQLLGNSGLFPISPTRIPHPPPE